MHPIHLVGLYTTRLPVFRWKARGYDWILVDSIGQPSESGGEASNEGGTGRMTGTIKLYEAQLLRFTLR